MPLSEFYRMQKGKLESALQISNNASANPSNGPPNNEFAELIWENGQLMVQSQSNRARKSPFVDTISSQTPKLKEKEIGNATNSKLVKFGATQYVSDDFPIPGPSGAMGLAQHDEMVPWLNYPINDSLQPIYCSEMIPELSSVTSNENRFSSVNKRNSYNLAKDTRNISANGVGIEQGTGLNRAQLFPWSSQSIESLRLGISGSGSNNTSNTCDAARKNLILDQISARVVNEPKKDSGLPNSSSGFTNFSHFSRPGALVRANLQNVAAENMGNENKNKNKQSAPESRPIDLSSSCSRMEKPLDESIIARKSESIRQEIAVKEIIFPNQAPGASSTKGMPDADNTNKEPVVASSSVGSGNSVERASNDLANSFKKRCREADDSEYRSEDVEEESVGVRKAANGRGCSGSKRSRAAEVHNLSERKRRDRINEKMRALQELIPNCNKVDKASMLDEAIEYLKTLQLQVQIMSMGAGLYMPPMMFPTGMQRIHPAHMTHYPPMGMGMGYGMGMLDMNGGASPCPMIPVPPMHGAHFPNQPILGANGFHGMSGPNLQFYGHIGQGVPISMPHPPVVPAMGHPPPNPIVSASAMGFDASSRLPVPAEVPISASMPISKDPNSNSQIVPNNTAGRTTDQTSFQCNARNENVQQTLLVPGKGRAPDVGGGGAADSSIKHQPVLN